MGKLGGQGGTAATTDLKAGLKDRSAKASDASMKCKGGSVNDEPTRKAVAPTPKSLGPRSA